MKKSLSHKTDNTKYLDQLRKHLIALATITLNWTVVEEMLRKTLALYISEDPKIGKYFTHNINSERMQTYFKEFVTPSNTNRTPVDYIHNHFSTNRVNRNKIVHALRKMSEREQGEMILVKSTNNPGSPVQKIPIKQKDMDRVVAEIDHLRLCVNALHHWKSENECPCLIDRLPKLIAPKQLNT